MHAPGHLRDAFVEWVESGCCAYEVGADVFDDGNPRPTPWVLGKLWNCSDIMPSDVCRDLDMEPGGTYAQAVQSFKSTARS